MTDPRAAPSPDLAALRAVWVNPFDETYVYGRLSVLTRQAPCGTRIPGGGFVPDVTVAARRGVPEDPNDGSPAAEAILTADGRGARIGAWCADAGHDPGGERWVYYERWTGGDVRHGYVCPACRKLTQTG